MAAFQLPDDSASSQVLVRHPAVPFVPGTFFFFVIGRSPARPVILKAVSGR